MSDAIGNAERVLVAAEAIAPGAFLLWLGIAAAAVCLMVVVGTLVGALIMQVIATSFNMLLVPYAWSLALKAAVVLAGLMQIVLSVLRAGVIGYFFPSSVIRGMLAGSMKG